MSTLPPLSLAYHGIADVARRRPGSTLFVGPTQFERQVLTLRRWGYQLVTCGRQLQLARHGSANGTASLSFDDGLADNYATVIPLLEGLGAPATVFVVTGWLGGRHPEAPWAPTLTIEQLRALHNAGVEVGGHTVNHPDLTRLPAAEAEVELRTCRLQLEDLLQAPIELAAYPFGTANAAVRDACRSAGYGGAFCARGHGSWSDPWDLPRQDMNRGSGLLGLRLKRAGRYEPLMRHAPARLARRIDRLAQETLRHFPPRPR
jgi:peptidoglycan/xylan/chitin deacetylase (PgdA/CDA1 family)